MFKPISIYVLIQISIIVLAIISWLLWDKRYKINHGESVPEGFEATNEVTVDPKDGAKYKVYFNPKTGERFYHKEN